MPTGLTNVIAVAAGGDQSLALLSNRTVTNWGASFATLPASLTNISAIAAGTNFCLAMRSNSTVIAWGGNGSPTNVPAGLTNVVAIAAGGGHALALKTNGTVVAWGNNSSGQTNVPNSLTNATANAMGIAAGYAHSMALRNDGTVVAWGDNTLGQTNSPALTKTKLIAAGGNQSLASTFSPLTQYPVDVTKDLLLIYNSTSTNSIVVKDYYLAHRPLVSSANVLSISCTTNEIADTTIFANLIALPVLQWLTNNPTKHPQYLILFPDIPTRVWTTNGIGQFLNQVYSVAYGISTSVAGIQPFVTSINMGFFDATNECIQYINKLAAFGTNGQLIISASTGGYGNTNYVLDDVRHGTGYGGAYSNTTDLDHTSDGASVWAATNGLIAAGVPSAATLLYDGLETCLQSDASSNCIVGSNITHVTGVSHMAGYICWGGHSSLGSDYARDNTVAWGANSGWWIIETIESYNGRRPASGGDFTQWFLYKGFGGTNYTSYENTPVGAVSHTDEPRLEFINDGSTHFGLWAAGKSFAICAWQSRRTFFFQAVGDPFTKR